MPEEMKKGTVVGNVAKDLGLNVKELAARKFQIVSHDAKKFFSANLENGDLIVSERIDRETLCEAKLSCFINLEAVIENPLNFYTITIEIQDVNDNAPSFSKKYFEIGISESSVLGVHFPLGNADDPDIGTNSIQSYTLSDSEHFSLSEKTMKNGINYAEIKLEKSLDREKQSSYELILTASDGGKPPKTGTAKIKIAVQDVNDNFPKFHKDIYETSINENVPIGFLILQLNAIDEDEGLNGQIRYLFGDVPENIYTLFSLDPVNGSITVIGNIDYEIAERYELNVEAKDGGNLAAHCKIYMDVTDINDNAPQITITSLSATIPEDSSPGTIIALINVYDLDSNENGEVTCELPEKLPFQLISSPGNYYKLVTTTFVDREEVSHYNITITAMDNGSPHLSTNKTVQLNISDVNDNPPTFEMRSYIVYIQENNLQGTSIHNIHASDCDVNENARITYSVLNNNIDDIPVSSFVSINSMTGVLYAQRSFDYEQLREFQFQVMAKDSGSPPLSSNVTVRICIIDKNDNAPKILYPSPDTEGSALFEFIPHSAEKGYLVTKVIAVDADSGHNAWLSYHLLQVQEPSFFTIGQYSGEIRINRDLPDMDSLRQKVVVVVKDNGVPSLSSTVTLSLVVAENFQQVVPEIKHHSINSDLTSNTTFYLVVSIALISLLFIITVVIIVISKFRKANTPTSFGAFSHNVQPTLQLTSDGTLRYMEVKTLTRPTNQCYSSCISPALERTDFTFLRPLDFPQLKDILNDEESFSINSEFSDVIQVRNID
ncbi:hypothetical protein GDO78_006379, partial [Eleutherodactylus coqui]